MTSKKNKPTLPAIYTIGVYASTETGFFQKLTDNEIDTFFDIRRRRAVRGPEYAFANSKRLQDKLEQLSIKYIHEMELAPTNAIMALQNKSDEISKIPRRQREELSSEFKTAYVDKILSKFDVSKFIHDLGKSGSKKVVLFCVEKLPVACHRSLVTNKIKELFQEIDIVDL